MANTEISQDGSITQTPEVGVPDTQTTNPEDITETAASASSVSVAETPQALAESERNNVVEVLDEDLMRLVEAGFHNQGREAVPLLLKHLKKEWARKALLVIADREPMAILNVFESYKDEGDFAETLAIKAFSSN